MRLTCILLLAFARLSAQAPYFSFGLSGGVPLSRGTGSIPYGPDQSPRYTLGLNLEASFTDHISVVFNPNYRRTGVDYGIVPGSVLSAGSVIVILAQPLVANSGTVRSNSLELPVIGRYTFQRPSEKVRPFAGAGFALQTAWQTVHNTVTLADQTSNTTQTYNSLTTNRTAFDTGVVVSAGAVVRQGRFRYLPELRFTRWGNANTSHFRSQLEALFSVRF
jgi:hypothetical protein